MYFAKDSACLRIPGYELLLHILNTFSKVVQRSSITSCYDDTDNVFANTTRGSLPLVVVESWSEVTKTRLESEAARIGAVPRGEWDWRRLLLRQWAARIRAFQDRPD